MAQRSDETSFDERKQSYLSGHLGLTLVLLLAGWTSLVAYSNHWNQSYLYREKVALATSEARSLWNKDMAFREWATRHGGVYVPPTDTTPPSPYLAHLPDRDVMTTDGKRLTLLNPAYMMRQMTEEFEQTYGIKGKITGLRYLNPVNAPDTWEKDVLEAFSEGKTDEVVEETSIGEQRYLRLMKPMYMTPGCEKCHAVLGYKTGDLRGGISVSVPLAPYLHAAEQSSRAMSATHLGIWMLGVLGLWLAAIQAVRKRRERVTLLSQLEQAALYDDLTALPTRALFEDRIRQAIRISKRDPQRLFGLCFIDLDRFKQINDTYGHAVGDELLIQVGGVLSRAVRPLDTVARLGGDEYIVLLNQIADAGEAVAIAERILEELNAPFMVAERTVQIGASVGIALSDGTYDAPETMIRHADIAMFRAKRGSGRRIEVFNTDMQEDVRQATELESMLRQALQNREFEVHYQPVVHLGEQRIASFEALLRWHHPLKGSIPRICSSRSPKRLGSSRPSANGSSSRRARRSAHGTTNSARHATPCPCRSTCRHASWSTMTWLKRSLPSCGAPGLPHRSCAWR